MKISITALRVLGVILLFVTASSNAALHSRLGGQAYYDDVLDISWTADASISGTGTIYDHLDWVDTLTIEGVTGWRLAEIEELNSLYHATGVTWNDPDPFTSTQDIYLSSTWEDIGPYGIIRSPDGITFAFFDSDPSHYAWAVHDGDVDVAVNIDVDPWSTDNLIRPNSDYPIAVAVQGSEEFDATQIDPATVTLGFAANTMPLPWHADFDSDTHTDALFGFATQDTGIFCNDAEVTLTGQTYSAVWFSGTDAIDATDCLELMCHTTPE
jgi:hypothetical protein